MCYTYERVKLLDIKYERSLNKILTQVMRVINLAI